MNGATGGAWSNVYVGCAGAVPEPSAAGAEPRVSVVDQAPVIAAKPYLVIDDVGRYNMRVPLVAKDVVGAALDAPYRDVPFESVFVADASRHGAREINEALRAGLDVVLAPGIFQLDEPIRMSRPGAVVMGLGYSTLVAPASGAACVIADDAGGMRLASVVLQASEVPAGDSSLLRWGGDGRNGPVGPERRFRCARRAGVTGRASVTVHVASRASDNLRRSWSTWRQATSSWTICGSGAPITPSWRPGEQRAGPGEQYHLVVPGECSVKNGLVVDGDDVTAYGLAVEHTDQDQVIWRGERGRRTSTSASCRTTSTRPCSATKGTPATASIAAVKSMSASRPASIRTSATTSAWCKRPSSRRDTAEVSFMPTRSRRSAARARHPIRRTLRGGCLAGGGRALPEVLLMMCYSLKHEVLLDRAALVHVAVAREVRVRRRVVGPLRVARRREIIRELGQRAATI